MKSELTNYRSIFLKKREKAGERRKKSHVKGKYLAVIRFVYYSVRVKPTLIRFSELAYFFHFPTVGTTQVYFINLTYLSIKDQQGS